jgi:hypothetical protein
MKVDSSRCAEKNHSTAKAATGARSRSFHAATTRAAMPAIDSAVVHGCHSASDTG